MRSSAFWTSLAAAAHFGTALATPITLERSVPQNEKGQRASDENTYYTQSSSGGSSRQHYISVQDLKSNTNPSIRSDTRKLTGKFLHITDLHPDPYFKVHSNTDENGVCHRGKGPAGFYGAETSGCDAPFSLLNATFEWIKNNIVDEVDFVIWTGDSARHDNDEKIPRNRSQVIELNRMVANQMRDTFGAHENWDDSDPHNDLRIPVVPTFGNNDILPHNVMTDGPNYWTKQYLDIWQSFIPEAQRHQFARGGWFQVEVIPGKLSVISLNTIYFFDSNGAVDGCGAKQEPGYQQFEWLRVQLDILRERGMKTILMGHVAPARVESKVSWDESCWQKYTLWMHKYRDVISGSLYGHMNIDHFFLQDWDDVKKHVRHGHEYLDEDGLAGPPKVFEHLDDEFTIESAQDYLQSLRDTFAQIPRVEAGTKGKKKGKKGNKGGSDDLKKIGGEYAERYSLTLVSPSVVPNYFPTLRIFSYNTTGLESLEIDTKAPVVGPTWDPTLEDIDPDKDEDATSEHLELRGVSDKKRQKRYKFKVPSSPPKSALPGPGYANQPFTLLGYAQYYANLTYINNDFTQEDEDGGDWGSLLEWFPRTLKWKKGKHHGKTPKHPKARPKKMVYRVEYDTQDDKLYGLGDLTVRSYLDLANRIAKRKGGKSKAAEGLTEIEAIDAAKDKKKKKKHHKKKNRHNKAWFTFVRRAFVGTLNPEDIEDEFGLALD